MVRLPPGSDPGGGPDRNYFAEPGSFAAFYRVHYPRLVRYLARKTRNPQDALDLTAETFLRAWKARATLRGDTEWDALGWIFVIANRQLAHRARRGKVETRALERLRHELPATTEDDLGRIDEIIDAEASADALDEALRGLSPAERDVVKRRVVDELSWVEIAELDGYETPTAARLRGSRALAKLRVRLGRGRQS
jgi:RNA polymerase sigma factor (sigma-70 family)